MAKRKRIPKLTPEELARREQTTRMLEERIAYRLAREHWEDERIYTLTGPERTTLMLEERLAYRRAKEREEDERRARESG
jgi:hypothetical protein